MPAVFEAKIGSRGLTGPMLLAAICLCIAITCAPIRLASHASTRTSTTASVTQEQPPASPHENASCEFSVSAYSIALLRGPCRCQFNLISCPGRVSRPQGPGSIPPIARGGLQFTARLPLPRRPHAVEFTAATTVHRRHSAARPRRC
jgi:hypothetical protein